MDALVCLGARRLGLNIQMRSSSPRHESSNGRSPLIPILAPLFQGEWSHHGQGVSCPPHPPPPPGGSRHALSTWTSQHGMLLETLTLHARHMGERTQDLRAATSMWSLDYLWLLLPPAMAGVIFLRRGLPLDPASCLLDIDARGAPVQLQMPDSGCALQGDASIQAHLEFLTRQHLSPLFSALHSCSGLPIKILWGNAVRILSDILETMTDASNVHGDETTLSDVARHGSALLTARVWLDLTPNPLWVHGGRPASFAAIQAPSSLYAQCCLRHRLAGQVHCSKCPLEPTSLRTQHAARRVSTEATPDSQPASHLRRSSTGFACDASRLPLRETDSG